MNRALSLLVASFMLLSAGCRSYRYSKTCTPAGANHRLSVQTFCSDAGIEDLEIDVDTGTLRLRGYSQRVNNETISALSEGITRGIITAIRAGVLPGL